MHRVFYSGGGGKPARPALPDHGVVALTSLPRLLRRILPTLNLALLFVRKPSQLPGNQRRPEDGPNYRAHYVPANDGQEAAIVVESERHGQYQQSRLSAEFFESSEYESLTLLGARLRKEVGAVPLVRRGQREQQEKDFAGVLAWLMSEARRGLYIQRYKGLGEMNPEQLWETTMDAGQRRLSQVQIEDAVGADEIFTVLMGEEVAPRRDFIQRNAFAVGNLDV